jgi:hypothetical protein
MGLHPPGIKRLCTEIFPKYIFDKAGEINTPLGFGPTKKFQPKNPAGAILGRFKRFTGLPALPSWIPPSEDRGGAVVNLKAVDIPWLVEVWRCISACRCSRRARSPRMRVTTPWAGFLMPTATGASTAQARTSGLGSESETGTPRDSPSPESM